MHGFRVVQTNGKKTVMSHELGDLLYYAMNCLKITVFHKITVVQAVTSDSRADLVKPSACHR